MKQLNWYQIFGQTHTIPDGRTVTPTDDIQIWLNCANIWDKTYTTLAEVLADTDTLSALIASNNAVDYMVRSTTWAVSVSVPNMTSDTTPSGEVIFLDEHSDYKGYKAFDNNASTFWNTGSSTLPTWLGYDFGTPKRIESVTVQFASYNTSATVKVQGSDDKSTWVDESEETVVTSTTLTTISVSGYYRYHRLYISTQTKTSTNSGCIITLQFSFEGLCDNSTAMSYIGLNNYCANILLADSTWCDAICNSEYFESVLNVKVPTMTSNTIPSGECFASSIFSSSYDAWKAFNESTSLDTDRWSSAINVLAYIGYKFTESYKIKAVKYLVRVSSSDIYKSYTAVIEGSNDNAIWETIKTLNNDAQSVPIAMVDTISSETSWQYVRFRFTSFPYTNPNNDGYSGMFALQFYGRKDI